MIGRNDPCPCGSGKKYKKCHLAVDEAARQPQRPEPKPSPLHALDRRVVEKILSFAERELGVDLDALIDECFEPDMATELAIPWLAYTEPYRDRTMAEHFLERHRSQLSPRELEWIEAVGRSWMTVWEVTAVDPGYGMTLTDLLTGERRDVQETGASLTLEVHDAMLGRVVDCMGESVLAGSYPQPLRPRDAAEVVARFRRRLKIRRKLVPPDRLRTIESAATLLTLWQDAEEEVMASIGRLPELENTDGDPILLTSERYRFDAARRKQVLRRLEALDGAEWHEDEGQLAIVRDDTVIAHFDIERDRLTIETNSIARADAVKDEVEQELGGLIRWESRSHSDPLSAALDEDLPPPPPATAEEMALIRGMKERHYAEWLDHPLPILGGRTPREAAKSRGGREQLTVVLKEIAQLEAHFPEGERFDVQILREALGI